MEAESQTDENARDGQGDEQGAQHGAGQDAKAGEHDAHDGNLARRAWKTAFINRNFALLWWGQTVSSIGDYAWDTALILWIATVVAKGQSWAPIAVSGAVLAAMIPQIVAGPIAGVFVDRWDKRHTMIVMTIIQAALAALLIVPVVLIGPQLAQQHAGLLLGIVFADIVLLTTCAQFFLPAQLALIKDIVQEPKQDQAIEMTQAIHALAVVIGPPVAAGLVFGLGVQFALLMNSVTFVASFVAVFLIVAPPAARSVRQGAVGHFWREFVAGLKYVVGHDTLLTILISEILTWLGFGALQSLGYFFITEDLHAPPGSYGLFAAIFGLGAILGGVLVTLFGKRLGLRHILWMALVVSGSFLIIMSHLVNYTSALVAAFFFGVSATSILITAGPLAVDTAEKQFVGRVMSVLDPAGRLAALVSVVIGGALVGSILQNVHASILGLKFDGVNIIFTGAGALAIAGGIYVWTRLRRLREMGHTRANSLKSDDAAEGADSSDNSESSESSESAGANAPDTGRVAPG